MLRTYLRPHVPALLAVAAMSLVGAAGTLLQPLLTRSVLDGIAGDRSIAGQVVLLIGLLLTVAVLSGLCDYLLQRIGEGLVLTTRSRLAAHLLRLPVAEHDRRRTGDLLSRLGADTTLLRAVVTSGLFETVTGALMMVGATVAMAALDRLLFGVTLAALCLGLAPALFFASRIRGLSELTQARIGAMTATVERALTAVRTIRASQAEERETGIVVASARWAYAAGLRMARTRAIVQPLSGTAVQAAFLLVLGVGGARVASGAITVGDLVAFILFLFLLVVPLGQALNAYAQLQAGLGALHRIEEVLRQPIETANDHLAPPTRHPPTLPDLPVAGTFAARATGTPAVEFSRVCFAYAAGGPLVLRDVSFTVPYGTRTALVGPSGAGKSTLLALVERFYEITSGQLRVGGVDVRTMPRDALRRQLGYVEQDSPVLAGTLRDNLLLAKPDATEDALLDVLYRVNLADVVDRTPSGLYAQVGEGGVLLSGGERQRLALARALLAAAPILLLDEPTSNLDARNEAALRRAITAVAAERTLLVVAHRLSTVVDADQIVVLDRGQVAAVGPHGHLVEANALYRELAAHQLLVAGHP